MGSTLLQRLVDGSVDGKGRGSAIRDGMGSMESEADSDDEIDVVGSSRRSAGAVGMVVSSKT